MTVATPKAGESARILVVDDLPANLGVLLTCLNDAGYKALVTMSGDKALVRLDQVQPDLIANSSGHGQKAFRQHPVQDRVGVTIHCRPARGGVVGAGRQQPG